jgi:hypothetical protein
MALCQTLTQILVWKMIVEGRQTYRYEMHRKTCMLHIDFVGAFDNVDRQLLDKLKASESLWLDRMGRRTPA